MNTVSKKYHLRLFPLPLLSSANRGLLFAAAFTAFVVLCPAGPARAQDNTSDPHDLKIRELEKTVSELAERIDAKKVEDSHGDKSRWTDRLKLHGYGELHYNSRKSSDTIKDARDLPAVLDFHRFVLGVRYNFTDRIVFDSEIDLEHALAASDLELEFAYLDFKFRDAFNVRVGSVLMPVGSLNEFHEPPLFYSVERPYFHTLIIPTSWMEGGVGAHGVFGDFAYRAYIVAGLSAVKLDGSDSSQFDPASGIRKGRQRLMNNKKSYAEDLAIVGRLEWKGVQGLQLGSSFYTGDSSQDVDDLKTGAKDVGDANVTITTFDARYRWNGFDFRGEYGRIRVGDADKISAALGGGKVMGSRIEGWFLETAYDVLHAFRKKHELFVFARYEDLDTHAEVPAGMMRDPEFARTIRTFGLAYRPVHNVALKTDVELWRDDAGQRLTRFNLGFGYDF